MAALLESKHAASLIFVLYYLWTYFYTMRGTIIPRATTIIIPGTINAASLMQLRPRIYPLDRYGAKPCYPPRQQ